MSKAKSILIYIILLLALILHMDNREMKFNDNKHMRFTIPDN